jgi:hypothetical protein
VNYVLIVAELKSQFSLLTRKMQMAFEKAKDELNRFSKEIEQKIEQETSYDPSSKEEEVQEYSVYLPWNTVEKGNNELRETILNLSKDQRNLLTEPPETSDFTFHMKSYVPMAKVYDEEDVPLIRVLVSMMLLLILCIFRRY